MTPRQLRDITDPRERTFQPASGVAASGRAVTPGAGGEMSRHEPALDEIEEQLRTALARYRDFARVRGDFLEAIIGLHEGLERALDAQLARRQNPPSYQPDFAAKAELVIPAVWRRAQGMGLVPAHDECIHPGQAYYYHLTDDDIRRVAVGYVELVQDSWPALFESDPPAIKRHPRLYERQDIIDPGEAAYLRGELTASLHRQEELRATLEEQDARLWAVESERDRLRDQLKLGPAPHKIPWLSLPAAILLLLPIPLLLGFGGSIWRDRPGMGYWLVVPSVVSLGLVVFAARHLWRFVRAIKWLYVIPGLATALVLAVIALLPFTTAGLPWDARTGQALQALVGTAGRTVAGYVTGTYEAGALLVDRHFPPTSGVETVAESTPTAAPTQEPTATGTMAPSPSPTPAPSRTPRASATPSPTSKPSRTPTATPGLLPPGEITVGARVVVQTQTGAGLIARAAPGIESPIRTQFDNGAVLEVMGGPVDADNYTWWRVEGAQGDGWSVGAFLRPYPTPTPSPTP
jgi:hypothetical protein